MPSEIAMTRIDRSRIDSAGGERGAKIENLSVTDPAAVAASSFMHRHLASRAEGKAKSRPTMQPVRDFLFDLTSDQSNVSARSLQ